MAKPTKKPTIPPKPIVLTNGIILVSMPLILLYFLLFWLLAISLLLLLPRYLSIARRIYLLLGISPRFWSIFCRMDLGKVIPSFTVLSITTIVLLVILVECTMAIAKSFSIADCLELS